jgi:transcriptional regulator with XRE-family HTH domain
LTQEQLARRLALHQSQVARLEAGNHTPTLETLVRLARHLGMTLTVTATPTRTILVATDTSQS